MTQQHQFTMDPNLLVSVIKSQAGTLSKAILEGVMNSIDAGASRVDVSIQEDRFIIEDNGRGFASEEQIVAWFGRFGTPHEEGDSVYGKYRMGRGQMFAFAVNTWTSGNFCMKVDIENSGLNYQLTTLSSNPVKGCRVEGMLYRKINDYGVKDLLTELRQYIAYAPKPVYVNGQLFGAPAGRLKSWTFEDEHAWYKVSQESDDLQVYNQGVFVESMSTWRTGMGGTIVSKRRLEVNFARNSIMEGRCNEWAAIRSRLEGLIFEKLAYAQKLEEGERKFLSRRLNVLVSRGGPSAMKAKIITDPSGKHLSMLDLKAYKRFVYIADDAPFSCAMHGSGGLFVVNEKLLCRFGMGDMNEWLKKMQEMDCLVEDYEVIEQKELSNLGLGGSQKIDLNGLTIKERAAFTALTFANQKLAKNLVNAGLIGSVRELLVGKHKTGSFIAWTDGKTFVTANKRFLKLFDSGLDGAVEWLNTLVHEYMHDSDDSESHSHGEVFYRKFHDAIFTASSLNIGSLAQQVTIEYLRALSELGAVRPHLITRQLKPTIR